MELWRNTIQSCSWWRNLSIQLQNLIRANDQASASLEHIFMEIFNDSQCLLFYLSGAFEMRMLPGNMNWPSILNMRPTNRCKRYFARDRWCKSAFSCIGVSLCSATASSQPLWISMFIHFTLPFPWRDDWNSNRWNMGKIPFFGNDLKGIN